MHALDASGIVHGWDNYPIGKFPRLWEWVESQIQENKLVISSVAALEVRQVSPDCADWLESADIEKIPMSVAMLNYALNFKAFLDIVEEQYHSSGVDEKDLFIIANAKALERVLISNEAVQNIPPLVKARYKIPAVCGHVANIECINFLDYINASNATF